MSEKINPDEDPTSIGNILIKMGLIEDENLVELVDEFKLSEDQLLGEFLVKKTSITEKQITIALKKQCALRNVRVTHDAIINVFDAASKSNKEIVSRTEEIVNLTYMIAMKG